MPRLQTRSAAFAAAAALLALAPSLAQAQYPAQTCALRVDTGGGNAVLSALAGPGPGVRWELAAFHNKPGGGQDLSTSGRIAPNRSGWTTLASASLGMSYVRGPGEADFGGGFRRPHARLADAELGEDASLLGELRVYDQAGNMVCRTRDIGQNRLIVRSQRVETRQPWVSPSTASRSNPRARMTQRERMEELRRRRARH